MSANTETNGPHSCVILHTCTGKEGPGLLPTEMRLWPLLNYLYSIHSFIWHPKYSLIHIKTPCAISLPYFNIGHVFHTNATHQFTLKFMSSLRPQNIIVCDLTTNFNQLTNPNSLTRLSKYFTHWNILPGQFENFLNSEIHSKTSNKKVKTVMEIDNCQYFQVSRAWSGRDW